MIVHVDAGSRYRHNRSTRSVRDLLKLQEFADGSYHKNFCLKQSINRQEVSELPSNSSTFWSNPSRAASTRNHVAMIDGFHARIPWGLSRTANLPESFETSTNMNLTLILQEGEDLMSRELLHKSKGFNNINAFRQNGLHRFIRLREWGTFCSQVIHIVMINDK